MAGIALQDWGDMYLISDWATNLPYNHGQESLAVFLKDLGTRSL